jgi:hypothetical protein
MKPQNKSPWRKDRRAEIRRRISDVAVIKSAIAGVSVAEVTEISPSGVRVRALYPFPVGTEVEVVREDQPMLGSVRSCMRIRANQFHLGIGNLREACTDSQQSELWTRHERLTDVLR